MVVGEQHHHDHDRHGDHAVDHGAPEQRPYGIDRREVEQHAAERRERDDRVELARLEHLVIEAALPLECFGDGIGGGSGEHRHREHAGADDAEAEQQEGGVTGDGP